MPKPCFGLDVRFSNFETKSLLNSKMPKVIAKSYSTTKIRRIQPERKVKKADVINLKNSRKIDVIGELVTTKSMTGQRITQKIFSYVDFSTLQRAREVSSVWNSFLSNDRLVSKNMLRKTKPYFETVFRNMTDFGTKYSYLDDESSVLYDVFLEEFFERIKTLKYFNFHIMFKILKKIFMIVLILDTHFFHRKCIRIQKGLEWKLPDWIPLLGKAYFPKDNEESDCVKWVKANFEPKWSPFIKWLMTKFNQIEARKLERYWRKKAYARARMNFMEPKVKLMWKRQLENDNKKIRLLLKTLLEDRMRINLKKELFSHLEQNLTL